MSGKRTTLPSSPPLRTVRASFNAYGSSLRQRPLQDAAGFFSNWLSVDLAVAVRVEQIQVLQRVVAAVASPLAMVDMPGFFLQAEELAAHRASPLLLSASVRK